MHPNISNPYENNVSIITLVNNHTKLGSGSATGEEIVTLFDSHLLAGNCSFPKLPRKMHLSYCIIQIRSRWSFPQLTRGRWFRKGRFCRALQILGR
jgi:hypothetical protein